MEGVLGSPQARIGDRPEATGPTIVHPADMTIDERLDILVMQVENLERLLDRRLDRLERLLADRVSGIDEAARTARTAPEIARARTLDASVSTPPPVPVATPHPPPVGPAPPPSVGPAPPPPVGPAAGSAGGWTEDMIERLLRLAGIALVLLASVFLVRTAIIRGWIGPELQLLGASMIGAGLLASAFPLAERRRPWATTMATGGVATLAICAAAGNQWLDLYSPSTALGLVTVAAAVSLLVAGRLGLEPVAMAVTAALLIVPTWSRIVADAPVALIGAWLGGFAVVVSIVGLWGRWIGYKLLSGWATACWVLGLAVAVSFDQETGYALGGGLLVGVVGLTLWSGPLLTAWRLRLRPPIDGSGWLQPGRMGVIEVWAAALVPLWAWGSLLAFLGRDPGADDGGSLGFLLAGGFLALAAVLALGVALTSTRPVPVLTRLLTPLVARGPLVATSIVAAHLLGAGALAAVVAVSWLDGSTAAPILALQAVITALAAHQMRSTGLWVKAYLVAGLAGLFLVDEAVVGLTADALDPGRIAATGITVVALVFLAEWVARHRNPRLTWLLRTLAWLGSLGSVASAFLAAPQGQAIVSSVWAVAAGAALAIGVRRDQAPLRNIGLVTLGVVLVKLLTVDLAAVDPLWRVGLFLVIGLGLLRLGYALPSLAAQSCDESAEPQ